MMNKKRNILYRSLLAVVLLLSTLHLFSAEVSRLEVEKQIEKLQGLIEQVRQKGHDVQREELAAHTALLFLDYADYDEANPAETLEACEASSVYNQQAEAIAALLPNHQRSESLILINEAIQTLEDILSGKIPQRKSVPRVDWANLRLDGASLLNQDGHPIFVNDYNFKPGNERLTQYYGYFGGYHYDFGFTLEDWSLPKYKQDELDDTSLLEPTMGSAFLGHGLPENSWMHKAYPGIGDGARTFTKYDIDHPKVREIWEMLLGKIAPAIDGHKCQQLGYMLTNEPHWHTAAHTWDTPVEDLPSAPNGWDTGDLGVHSKEKFKVWLEEVHGDIETLNRFWKTSYADFEDVEITLPIDNELLGKAKWYDWMKFNQYRCTSWFEFLIGTARKHDPDAICTVKVMPYLWTQNKGDHGLDYEAITEMSGVIGNDAAAGKKKAWGAAAAWESDYIFNWHEMCMGYDFFRSVSPDKVNYNSENHYTMRSGYQDLYMGVEYPRCVYWLSALFGADVNCSWVWSRKDDDANKAYPVNIKQCGASHVGAFTTQPRVLNEVTKTHMELSAHGYDIAALSTLRQPIRIYYTETSALNKRTHMDGVFELYEELFFRGIPIGFATDRIIKNQDNSLWDVILLKETEYVTVEELKTLQTYLDNGGTIIMDRNSASRTQYMIKHPTSLTLNTKKGGKIIQATDVNSFVDAALTNMKESSKTALNVTETNSKGRNFCIWRSIEYPANSGRYVLTLTNVGKEDVKIKITLPGQSKAVECRDLFTYQSLTGEMTVKPEQIVFIETGNLTPLSAEGPTCETDHLVYPTPFSSHINVTEVKECVDIYNISGCKIYSQTGRGDLTINTSSLMAGVYVLNIDGRANRKVVKI